MTHLAYPNPIDYIVIIGLVAMLMAAIVKGIELLLARNDLDPAKRAHLAPFPAPSVHVREYAGLAVSSHSVSDLGLVARPSTSERDVDGPDVFRDTNFISRTSRFRSYFLPLMYGIIPVVGADYFARQLPKFFEHATRIVPATQELFGAGSTKSVLYNTHILSVGGIVNVQLIIIAIGTAASMWVSWKIANQDLLAISRYRVTTRLVALALPLACGIVAAVLYAIMHAAP